LPGNLPTDGAPSRLAGAPLIAQNEPWRVTRR
jgi:hypothetical protein